MTEKQTLQAEAKTLTQEPVVFTIDIVPKNRVEKMLQWLRLKPKQKRYSIRPITYGNLQRISSLLLNIEINADKTGLDHVYELMESHADTMIQILAIAITNSRHKPSQELIDELAYNMTATEAVGLIQIVINQMNVAGFLHTIILIRGLSVTERQTPNGDENKTSLQNEKSPITAETL